MKKRRLTSHFEFLDLAFRHVDSGKTFKADDLTTVEHYRLDGASDPDDMSVVYAVERAAGPKGIVAEAFGVYANPALIRFLENVKILVDIEGSKRRQDSFHLVRARRLPHWSRWTMSA